MMLHTVINILLWGCASWALTEELRRKLEVCHQGFLRKMVGITICDVKDNHISNKQVREELALSTLQTFPVELFPAPIALPVEPSTTIFPCFFFAEEENT